MRRDYLGDAKDLAKRHIFDLLRGDGTKKCPNLVGKLFVFPMVSDMGCLSDQGFFRSYRSILGGELLLLAEDRLWGGNDEQRTRYLTVVDEHLSSVEEKHSIFLDPDTGVMEDDSSKAGRGRVRKRDLACLLNSKQNCTKDRIIVVFDDSYSFGGGAQLGHGEEARRLNVIGGAMKKKLEDVAALIPEQSLKAFGYIGMAVNLMLLATPRAANRLEEMKRRLERFLCDAAERRIV